MQSLYVTEDGVKRDVPTIVHLGGGAAAGVSYWTAFYPADTVKVTELSSTRSTLIIASLSLLNMHSITPLRCTSEEASAHLSLLSSPFFLRYGQSRLQTSPDAHASGIVNTFKSIVRAEGVRGLYKGWGITVLRAAPAHAAIFAVYEAVLKTLNGK